MTASMAGVLLGATVVMFAIGAHRAEANLMRSPATSITTQGDDVDRDVERQLRDKHVSGAVVIVLRNGEIVRQRAVGLANIDLGVPATIDDVYPIASITKIFAATGIFLLIQDGALHLDDQVSRLLPGLPRKWNGITVLDCLTHTSGIADFPTIADSFSYPSTQDAALQFAAALPNRSSRDEQSSYNQTEFLLLKMILEKTTGTTLPSFLERRIFAPLGMQSARFGDSREVIPHRVSVYTRASPAPDRFHSIPQHPWVNTPTDRLFHSQLLFADYMSASAGLNMTGGDLAKFDAALHHGALLRPHWLEQMWATRYLKSGRPGDFTAGWMTGEVKGKRVVYHIGAGMAQYSTVPDDGLSLILLTNVQETKVWELSVGILDVLDRRPVLR
jgi:D-alanyl-D-alanine carboxypeptidase